MALYAMGDMHLSFKADKPMDVFGDLWKDHVNRIRENCNRTLTDDDTFVIVGDHSWGKNLEECDEDLQFIIDLPGRKILTRGNHDMFWDAQRTNRLNRLYEGKLCFLQNNFYTYNDYALVGTKGYTFEGKDDIEHSRMLVEREASRLRKSFEKACDAGYDRFIMFLHYPPTNYFEKESVFTHIAEEYHAEQVVYAHCHGKERFRDSIQGMNNGILYSLVSGDYLGFEPKKILD